jgi:AcrR family transcriptional regulator/transposase-like protein
MNEPRKRAPAAADGGPPAAGAGPPAPSLRDGAADGGAAPRADGACRDWLWRLRLSPDGRYAFCPRCGRQRRFHRLRRRPSYSCDSCGHQLSPTCGTIFEKSSTSLCLWFRAIALVADAEEPLSAPVLADALGVTSGTARRMLTRIRSALPPAGLQSTGRTRGTVTDGAVRSADPSGVVTRIVAEVRGGSPGWMTSEPGDDVGESREARTPKRPPVAAKGRRARQGGAANKERILSAACAVIVEKGMAGARVSDIARVAGLSTTIIHYYFATKDDVLFAAMKWQNERETIRRAATVASDAPAVDKLVRFLEESMPPSGFAREEALIRFDLWGRAMRDPTYGDVLRPLREAWRRQIGALVEEGVAADEFHLCAPLPLVLEELTAVLDGYALQYVLGYSWMSAARLWELLSEYAARHLGVPRERFAEARSGA